MQKILKSYIIANSRSEAIKAARDKLTEYKAWEFGINEKVGEI
jgi:hypothetical protein